MSKTTITFKIDANKKAAFELYAEKLGTDPDNILRMFISSSLARDELSFSTPPHSSNQFELEEPTPEEEKIIAEYKKQIKDGTFEYVSAEKIYELIGYNPKNV